jgi:hypothetical protein
MTTAPISLQDLQRRRSVRLPSWALSSPWRVVTDTPGGMTFSLNSDSRDFRYGSRGVTFLLNNNISEIPA